MHMQLKKCIKILFPLLVYLLLSACSTSPTGIQLIDNKVTFDSLNHEKTLVYTIKPENADKSAIEWISEDESIACFTDSATLCSKSEGETKVYATVKGTNIKSNKVSVVVTDKKAEEERKKAEKEALENAQKELEAQNKKEPTSETVGAVAAGTITASGAATHTQEAPKNNSSTSQTVYIGKTGTKYHRQTCGTLKGKGRAITLSEALAQGREPCKRCKP